MQSIFMVSLLVKSIVLMVLHQFLVVMVNLHMDIEALETPLQYIFDLLILLMQSIFMVNLMVQSIVLMDLQHF